VLLLGDSDIVETNGAILTFMKSTYLLSGFIASAMSIAVQANCQRPPAAGPQLLWGDLHVHTQYSLDANVYGTLASPADAYKFARGEALTRADGSVVQLERPLDFVAVTEHAEWLDFTLLCESEHAAEIPDCQNLLANRGPENGVSLFRQYVVPSITAASPQPLEPCAEDPARCNELALGRWQSVQAQTEAFNAPCEFTTLHGYEWSHTPNFSHAHRNVIFRTGAVTKQAIDYIHYPSLDSFWNALDQQCREEDGCRALTIPHNTNMGDGISFDASEESVVMQRQRAHYERVVEITQEKGTSECLPPYGQSGAEDCDFELYITDHSRPKSASDFTETEWNTMRSTYVRGLLGRGLALPTDDTQPSPLRMGVIGSTDTHSATPGYVDEHVWSGSTLAGTDFDGAMLRKHWSPGGLAAVWAAENTREAIFDALYRREVYATSGARIGLRFGATAGAISEGEGETCQWRSESGPDIAMGAEAQFQQSPVFSIQAQGDTAALAAIEMVRLTWRAGTIDERVIGIWGASTPPQQQVCVNWQDGDFDPAVPTLWYPRVKQQSTPRWTAVQCESVGRCDEFPEVNVSIQERAWGSPIWHIPH